LIFVIFVFVGAVVLLILVDNKLIGVLECYMWLVFKKPNGFGSDFWPAANGSLTPSGENY